MRIFWKHLLLCTLITLLSGNAADKSPPYDGILMQNEDFSEDDEPIDYRLPTAVKPISYDIMLIPQFNNYTFKGIAKIEAEIKSATNEITLHVGNIEIELVSVTSYDTNKLNSTYEDITEKYTITLPNTLKEGKKVLISFTYNGILADNMIGFYRSSYIDEKGQTKWLAATQFQTTHARHAFPCFDEPSFKANFTIRIARDKNYKCLSNMPLASSGRLAPGGKIWDVFEETVPMSTYLVAFIISELNPLPEEKNFTVWSKPSTINQAKYALKIGIAALDLFNETFQQEYELPKMDMVAVPDFAAGAMENWGLVTYREARMLYDEKESSALAQQSVASVVVHELTHMWFGNLVTPEWWSCLWLSEAFATYFQYFGTAEIENTWNMKKQFVVEQHQSALIADGLESSLSMTRKVSTKSHIAGIGDTITYAKGASIVRMMNLIFGTEVFNIALQNYIQNNKKEGLGRPDALWEAIKDQVDSAYPALNLPVKTIMDTWTTKPGYPVISITINDNGIVNIAQERFLLRNLDKTPTNVTWYVPITIATQSKPDFDNMNPKYWISDKKSTVNLKINPKDWVVFNVQSSGFYRVNYNAQAWQNIFNALNNKVDDIHVLNRAGIVDDLLNLGRAGYQNYDLVLEGLLYLKKETNYLPFKAALNGLEYLNKRFTGSAAEHFLFKTYVLSLIDNVRLTLGYEDRESDDRLTTLLRREVNYWACNFNDIECVTNYTNKFGQWKANATARIKPNERTTAYCVAIRHGTSEDWEFLWKEYSKSNHAADQMVILSALGCSQNTTILEKYLKSAISNYETSQIRKHDSTSVFAAVYNSGLLGAEYVLDFVEKHHKEMEEYYGGQGTIATILDGVSQYLSTFESVDKFEKLINNLKTDFASIQTSLNASLRIAKYELGWYNSNSPSIIRRLREYDRAAYRLPTDIKPTKYFISITPYLKVGNFTVDGKVKIEANVIKPTTQITLHSSEIKFHEVNVMANEKKVNISRERIIALHDFYVLYLAEELTAGTRLTIEIKYTSHLNASELRGFYKSSYVNEKGETRWLAASHLEPVGARKMFPCFDEPAMKAQFTVEVNVPFGYNAISNMKWDLIKNIDNHLSYTFKETMPMSTYLVAVIVSDFKSKSIQNTTKLAVYARPNAIDQADYALSVMSPLVNFFETTYKQKYQIQKLYMAALPDFPSGAMENWGLLTYKEANMLYDENHSPITNKQDIRNVIAHEISHQWFGNLVSPLWWKYLWLNEGFARYFQYHAPARTFNDTTLESQFVVDQVHSAFSADSSKSTHPMSHEVSTPREIQSIFDTITYAKGGSILRMVEKTYGTEVFNEALTDYLNKRKYSVATPEDLYAALQAKVNEKGLKDDIKTILDTWTTQGGYPVVNIDVTKDFITIEQERFFFKKHENDPTDSTIWHIPITWTSVKDSSNNSNTTPKLWLTTKTINIQKPSDSLLIFNTQQSGYYRVNYNEEHWMELIKYLKNEGIQTIHEINRAALIDDLMNLARAEYINYKTAISAITYLTKENSYFPWRAFFNNLPYLNNRLAGRDIEELYKKRLTSLIEELYTQLGFEDRVSDDDLTKMLRIHARKWACKLDVTDCKFRAAKYFQQKQHSETIPPNYRDVVYCTAMRMDKTNYNYNFLWKEYLNSNVTTDKLVILNSLACSENEEVLETLLLEAIKEDSHIRYQDSAKVFSNVYDEGLIGVEVVMKVIEKYYEDILNRHFNDYTKMEGIMSALASRLSTFDLYDQYQKLSTVLVTKEPLFKKSLDTYLVAAKYEFDWYDRNVPLIFEALDNWEETTVKQFSSNTYRLPKTLYPKLYNVYLTPYMKNGTFEGNVKIHMTVKTDTSLIVLNSHNLEIKNITVSRNGIKISSIDSKKNVTTQQLWIYLFEYVHANEEIIAEIDFNGILNDNMKGFYRSSYFDNNGNQHWLATTQFEPTHAREAFPCFDEPAFKAKFTINIQRLTDYKALSNMPLNPNPPNIKPKNDSYKWDTFETSNVDMSTYLVAFVVSKFEPAVDPENVTVNVWGRPEVVTHGTYAQEIGEKLIEKLQNITNIDYYDALPKLDLVGIPDFDMGAMENWGLATFREYGLFYDKDETTSTYEKYIITVIAHELTHMWFGNLVTCEWWDYIWLNEGFAQYFQSLTSDEIWPEYKFMDQFVVYELQSALSQDASISTHPMTNPVRTPEEIAGVFDYVAYGKSASVLRMIFNKFDEYGPKTILALRDYLDKHKYSTASPTDLWKSFEPHVSISLDNVTNVSIEEVMNTWTDQPGYPVVHATLTGYLLRLTQERFLMNRDTVSNEFYWIPIDVYVQSDNLLSDRTTVERKVWLGQEPRSVYINPNNDWFIVNYKQTGFYRVNYDTDSWKRLISKLNTKEFEAIDVLNRAQIIDDLFNLARASYVDYELLMNAVTYLRQETHHLPWKAFFNGLSYIYERFEQQIYQEMLNHYILDTLLSNVYKNVGFDDRENNKHLDKLNQELILQWACKLNKPECITKSEELFAAWHKDSSQRIPRNARPAVYCTAIRRGTTDDWEFLWNKYLEANLASEKKIIINALGCSTNKAILQTYLGRAIKMYDPVNAAIRRQDVSAVFASVYGAGPLGVTATLEFLIDKKNPVHDYFSKKEIADLFVNVASHISNEGQNDTLVNYIENWISDYPPGKIRVKLRSAITTAETNLLWYKNNAQKIGQWLLLNLPSNEKNEPDSSTRIESLNVVFMTLIALMSYLLSYY